MVNLLSVDLPCFSFSQIRLLLLHAAVVERSTCYCLGRAGWI